MHEPFGEHTFWPMLGQGTSLVVHLAVQVVWLVVALGPVRRASPQAGTLVAIAAVLQLLFACASPAVVTALGAVTSRMGPGMDAYLRVTSLWTIVGSVIGAGISGLLLAGVVRLARGTKRDARDPDLS